MDELQRMPVTEAKTAPKFPVILILDDIRSMHNVGAAFRTADAFGIEEIFLCGYTPVPPHRDIRKTALGATETVKWRHFDTTTAAADAAQAMGYKVYAVEQTHNSLSLQTLHWTHEPIALVFGNEVSGVQEDVLKKADASIEIPQWGAKHSLNVSVCMGVVLWELARQTLPQ